MIAPGKIEDKIGPEEVLRKTGVKPSQIVEWLALVGDSSDNIPGVPGVGAKTAAKLLNEWGSLNEMYNHLDRIKSDKIRGRLEDGRPDVSRNVQIITLDKNIKLPFIPEDLAVKPPDTERLRSFFTRMEFHSLAAGLLPKESLAEKDAEKIVSHRDHRVHREKREKQRSVVVSFDQSAKIYNHGLSL